ncbi:MAG: sugar transferase [Planctomycetota bacterium]|nr:MAG: sugar transferase [Planctomycetota bacterium]
MLSSTLTEETPIRESLAKRIFDIGLSSFGIILFFIPALIFALAIVLEEWGPVFYVQDRVGKDGKIFRFYKFRTMRVNADDLPPPENPEDDYRITKVGRFLRRTAMNELPQLINILKGDMSFVGPRPDLPECVEKNSKELPRYHLRHKVRPGLTGLAQVYAKKNAPERQKLRWDLLYVEKCSLKLDIILICRSVVRTLKGKWEL